jgi:hypothetical protein
MLWVLVESLKEAVGTGQKHRLSAGQASGVSMGPAFANLQITNHGHDASFGTI